MAIVAHWVKENATSRIPQRWIWLDTEATIAPSGKGESQQWRCAVTCRDVWESHKKGWVAPRWVYHLSPTGLWRYVDSETRPGARTIVVAHNMGYDVRISQALLILPALGWDLVRWQVRDTSCVLRWRRGGSTLWLVDSTGWFPASLERIGGLIDQAKTPLPAQSDSPLEWWRRCETDVAILRDASMQYLAWVKESGLGNWQPTAGAMAWANWRHLHYTHKVLIHDDVRAREAERSAAYTGRCEAWRWGPWYGGEWAEWDLPLAYPRAAKDACVPAIFRSHVQSPTSRYVDARGSKYRWLIYAHVSTGVPSLPARSDNHTLWPVGDFAGWYWDSELDIARECGATIRMVEAYRYLAAPALKAWAEWIIPFVEDETNGATALQRLVAKNWARALIGKFGTRYPQWEDWGDSTMAEPTMAVHVNAQTKAVGRVLSICGKDYGYDTEVDGDESAPAIMSAVMAECRIRLWRIMQVCGEDNLIYCDTDSVICNSVGSAKLQEWTEEGNGWGLRKKRTGRALTVLGPRQLIVGEHTRISGVSGHAERIAPNQWAGQRWERLEAAVLGGRLDAVQVVPTVWTVDGHDSRRRHLADGRTEPYELSAPWSGLSVPSGGRREI